MRREISDATTAHYIGEAVGAFAEEWHLEHPAGYNNGLCEGYAKLKQYRGHGAGLEGWTEVVESDKDRDVLLLVDMAIKAALEKLENKHGDSLNSDAVEKAEKDYAHGFEPDGDAFRWLVLQKAKDWLVERIGGVFAPVEKAEEPAAVNGKVSGGFVGFCIEKIKVMPTEEQERFLSVNSGDSSFYSLPREWNSEWESTGKKAYKKPGEGVSKAKKEYRKLNQELNS